jgi:AcrR family transcriptional regulator
MYRRAHPDCPSEKTIHGHFGSKDDLLLHLRAWIADKTGFDDIAAMLGPAPEPGEARASWTQSLVYLLQSGRHYKIGRSDRIERRVREIRAAMPEALRLVHSIRTDDPVGIEAYWHRRFADRRANGEWFRLSHADVAAFKRRKFQ